MVHPELSLTSSSTLLLERRKASCLNQWLVWVLFGPLVLPFGSILIRISVAQMKHQGQSTLGTKGFVLGLF